MMPTFGERFRELREARGLRQDTVAQRMKLKKPTPISLLEGPRKHIVPKPATIRRLAAALECQPWELLDGVVTEYDELRSGAPYDKNVTADQRVQAERAKLSEAQILLRRREREEARMAASHPADRLAAVAANILEVGAELRTWRPPTVARRSGSDVSPRARQNSARSRRRSTPKTTEK